MILFVNGLFTDRRFVFRFLELFGRLGPVNVGLQRFLSGYYQWKKSNASPTPEPLFNDFTELTPLKVAESAFYEVGVSAEDAGRVLLRHLDNLTELGRFIVAHVSSVVLGDRRVLSNAAFVEGIDLADVRFDPGGHATLPTPTRPRPTPGPSTRSCWTSSAPTRRGGMPPRLGRGKGRRPMSDHAPLLERAFQLDLRDGEVEIDMGMVWSDMMLSACRS